MSKAILKPLALASALSFSTLFSFSASATIVEFQTSHGNFKINLHDQTTPITVSNFLNYVEEGSYNNTVIHRLIPNFIVQGGGFTFEGDLPLTPIEVNDTITNEPIYSNVRATIAMAKPGSNSNGATSQWFINYGNNSANLDLQNAGFTVFGEVIDDGMSVLDPLAGFPICNDIPMPNFSAEQCAPPSALPGVENFITIHSVTIFDSSTVTDESLTSVKNTLINEEKKSKSSGGSFSFAILAALSLLTFRRKVKTL